MKGCTALLASAITIATSVTAITPVTIRGNAFWQGDKRFYIRGVDYQPGGASLVEDPLASFVTCKRDVAEFKKMGINTVRVYSVDNTKSHDACMNLLAENGIYLALDVNSGKYSINRADPAPSYNDVYLGNVFATMEMFAKYPNTLLFLSANEVINDNKTTSCAPYVKAVTRDMRAYIRARGLRAIPVGYSAADIADNRFEQASYMNCGPESVRSDFFAFNDYAWCDPSDFVTSGWSANVDMYSQYSIPLFLSEYGCIKNPPREFNEVETLFSSKMSPVYSGGLAYEYTWEPDNAGYGLVNVVSDSVVTPRNPDFTNFMTNLKNSPDPPGDGGYKTGLPPSKCPAYSDLWQVQGDLLPAIPSPAIRFFQNGPPPGHGLDGPGSQYAGTSSTTNLPAGEGGPPGSAESTGAASSNLRPESFSFGPIGCGLVVMLSSLVGMSLL